jgi:hypothetical protein
MIFYFNYNILSKEKSRVHIMLFHMIRENPAGDQLVMPAVAPSLSVSKTDDAA